MTPNKVLTGLKYPIVERDWMLLYDSIPPATEKLSSISQKQRLRIFKQDPMYKANQRAYHQRPDVKAKREAYYQRPEVEARRKAYYKAYYQKHKERVK